MKRNSANTLVSGPTIEDDTKRLKITFNLVCLHGTTFHLQVPVALFDILPENLQAVKHVRLVLLDCLYRSFVQAVNKNSIHEIIIALPAPTKYVLSRTNISFNESTENIGILFEVKCQNSLQYIQQSIEVEILKIIDGWIFSSKDLNKHIQATSKSIEDQNILRKLVTVSNGISFIQNGSLLVGADDDDDDDDSVAPVAAGPGTVVPFQSPATLEVEFDLPNKGKIQGLLIRKGVTVIVGGGFHGKSTLLKAISEGVNDKRAGDGAEFVVTERNSLSICIEVNSDIPGKSHRVSSAKNIASNKIASKRIKTINVIHL